MGCQKELLAGFPEAFREASPAVCRGVFRVDCREEPAQESAEQELAAQELGKKELAKMQHKKKQHYSNISSIYK